MISSSKQSKEEKQEEKILSPLVKDTTLDMQLRPKELSDYVGQEKVKD
ncbi:MAG: hypothetical protein G01um101477_261, partial [Candidatus Doudnabacteria bacterium Gr01-1014_77]